MSRNPLTQIAVAVASVAGVWIVGGDRAAAGDAQVATPANCVAIGTPSATLGFTYDHTESRAGQSQDTQYWESVTPTGSRVRIVKPGQTLVQASVYQVVDDVAVISRMTKAIGGNVVDSTDFRPGLVSDPFGRACAGKSWPVPSVTATFVGPQRGSAATPIGTLAIVNIREHVTVGAGTFETVHYVRTSQSRDEYWKSSRHGVIVKHIATVGRNLVTETLVAMK